MPVILGEEFLTHADLVKLAIRRLDEAVALLAANCYPGAIYLGGYAVECGLKACIAKQMQALHFPPSRKFVERCYNHDLQELFRTAGLWAAFDADCRSRLPLQLNWQVVKTWSEQKRYDPADDSLAAAQAFLQATRDPADGVLTWIQSHW